jgi:hypothetical protein
MAHEVVYERKCKSEMDETADVLLKIFPCRCSATQHLLDFGSPSNKLIVWEFY